MAFWAILGAIAKAAASTAAKGAALAGKGIAAAGKGAMAIAKAAPQKAIGLAKGAGTEIGKFSQGLAGKTATAATNLGQVPVRSGMSQSIGLAMNQAGKQFGQSMMGKVPSGNPGVNPPFPSVLTPNQTTKPSMLGKGMETAMGMMKPMSSPAANQTTEFPGISLPQITSDATVAPTMGKPLNSLTSADIAYYQKMMELKQVGLL